MKSTTRYKLAALAISSLLPSCKDSADAMSMNIVVFDVIDSVTKEKVNVAVTVDAPKINGIVGATCVEMPVNGPYRASWIATASKQGTIRIFAEGYLPAEIPKELVKTIFSNYAQGGAIAPKTIELIPNNNGK